jgi:phosphoglycerate dehydrogenase-like enzyme
VKDTAMRFALLDDYQGVGLSMADWGRVAGRAEIVPFREHIADEDALAAALADFDGVMLMRERTKFPRSLFEKLPRLRLLVTAAMWNASVDMDAAAERGVQVCGTGDWHYATAELALGLMIALARYIPTEDREMRVGAWQTRVGMGLHGQTLGIIGLGSLGGQMAGFGRMLGMEVLAWSQNLTPEAAAEKGAVWVAKEELLRRADVVSIHTKLSPRTRGLLGQAELLAMKPGAFLINTSRAPIVDTEALIAQLQAGRLAGAALDVFDYEPLAKDHVLRTMGNVVLTPHVGYVVEQNYRVFFGDTLEDLEAFLDGRVVRPLNSPVARKEISA